ncbi:ABC transporter substrate-binding protein [Thermodesulfobacteriota bacterium]
MKKTILILVVILLMSFMLGNTVLSAFAAGKAKSGGILRINMGRAATIIGNPLKIRGASNEYASIPLEGLLQFDPKNPGKLIPMLATSWKLASDKSNYTLNLRRGVKFHDGTTFNAQAVKWNLGKWLESKSPIFKDMSSVDVIDEHTVRINLSRWNNLILYNLESFGTYMISPTAYEKNGEEWVNYNPVGTGPFKLVDFKRSVSLTFEKFKDYYKEGVPLLDGLHISQIVDPMTAMASLKRGDIDVWGSVDQVSASELAKEDKWNIDIAEGPGFFLTYNSVDSDSPFYKQEVRAAVEYAIDRDRIAELSGRGFRKGVRTLLLGLDYKKAGTTPREYNPEKAKQLLKKAGYPNGFKVKLYFQSPNERDSATAFQSYLNAIGVEAELEPVAGAGWYGKANAPLKSGEMLYGWLRPSPSSLKAANANAVKGAWALLQMLKRPDGLDGILDQAFSEPDLGNAMGHLHRAEKLAYDFAMFCPVLFRYAIAVKAPYVKDAIYGYGFIPRFNLEQAWLDK